MGAVSEAAVKPVRAGIVVTGTEVITGTIQDKNGPWISQELAGRGVEVSHIVVVGDRPSDLEQALRFLGDDGMDLIVTSGGLGPTADDLTAEVVGHVRRARDGPRRGAWRRRSRRSSPASPRRLNFDAEALREANRKQAVVPKGSTLIDPAGTAPGLVVPVDDGPVVIVMPGPPRELHAMWPKALETEPVRAVLDRAEPYAGVMLRLFGIPESEIAKSLREIEEGGVAIDAARDHDLPAQGRARDRGPPPPRRRGHARRADRRHRRAPRPLPLQPRRRDDRLAARLAARRDTGSRRPSRAPAASWPRA